jgi:hypothetical protein
VKLYSEYAPRRSRQVLADVIALALVVAWIWFGATVYVLIAELATFGKQMEDAGAGFRATMTQVGDSLGGVVVIGPAIQAPFEGASGAGAALEDAGRSQQELTMQLALAVGVGVAVLPILMIVAVWILTRGRFVRRAGHAQALVRAGVGVDLLALRALTNQIISTIAKIDTDAWGRGAAATRRSCGNSRASSWSPRESAFGPEPSGRRPRVTVVLAGDALTGTSPLPRHPSPHPR